MESGEERVGQPRVVKQLFLQLFVKITAKEKRAQGGKNHEVEVCGEGGREKWSKDGSG